VARNIHPTAIIDKSAKVGEGTVIGPYVVVDADVVIGENCRIEPFVHIKRFVSMGSGNHIHSNACIGGEPQHLGFRGEDTLVEIGDNNIIRESVTIHRGTAQGRGKTILGSNCLLMAYAHIAHDCVVGNKVILANSVNLAGHVEVGDCVVVSGMAAVQQWIKIGEYAFLGGASGYNLDIPPYMLAHGVRGKLFGPNLIGLKRHGFTAEACQELKKAYRIIFRSGLGKEDALARVEAELPDIPEVARLVAFIRESKNGVAPASASKNGNGE
jgi:UDP-N-acetylglucosamine acyltransferase